MSEAEQSCWRCSGTGTVCTLHHEDGTARMLNYPSSEFMERVSDLPRLISESDDPSDTVRLAMFRQALLAYLGKCRIVDKKCHECGGSGWLPIEAVIRVPDDPNEST